VVAASLKNSEGAARMTPKAKQKDQSAKERMVFIGFLLFG
jgi:hypothetical protein